MTLRQATPGIRPEGRRLGTLRLGGRLEKQKIGLNPRAKASSRSSFSPLAGRGAPAGLQNRRDVAQGAQASCHSRLGAREVVTAAIVVRKQKR